MARLQILTETYRTPGFTPVGNVLAGQVVELVTASSIQAAAGDVVLGVALEGNVSFDDPAKYYDDINRGGLIGTTHGGMITVTGDDRGAAFDVANIPALKGIVYWNKSTKLYTSVSAGGIRVGTCIKTASGATDSLGIKLEI